MASNWGGVHSEMMCINAATAADDDDTELMMIIESQFLENLIYNLK